MSALGIGSWHSCLEICFSSFFSFCLVFVYGYQKILLFWRFLLCFCIKITRTFKKTIFIINIFVFVSVYQQMLLIWKCWFSSCRNITQTTWPVLHVTLAMAKRLFAYCQCRREDVQLPVWDKFVGYILGSLHTSWQTQKFVSAGVHQAAPSGGIPFWTPPPSLCILKGASNFGCPHSRVCLSVVSSEGRCLVRK